MLLKVNNDLFIELMGPEHKYELFHIIDTNREHLGKWLLWVNKRQAADDLDPVFPVWLKNFEDSNGFDAGIRYQGRLVGMISLHYIDWKNKSTSIGYFLSKEAEGRGIITKTISSLLTHIFEELGLNRAEIRVASGNTRSRAIPERLGFIQEGITRDGQWLHDHFEDLINYSMLGRDWVQKK
ncbi:GNAT family N-acetyltransferase [Peribacillus kribbensis]|uniref:GNAT family N-acetyltransferase n=1 Tax=Peribacillus kribbensis TaxID=356658 RepID=UPI0003F7710C|nr:GNAT family protein [Peribacillus kribbensis]